MRIEAETKLEQKVTDGNVTFKEELIRCAAGFNLKLIVNLTSFSLHLEEKLHKLGKYFSEDGRDHTIVTRRVNR